MADSTIKTLMVELDCLLDTRIGTISLINPAAAVELVSKKYWERTSDNFEELTNGLVTDEEFIDRYEDRDLETLLYSRPTNILKLLHEITNSVAHQRVSSPDTEHLIVEVNTYPYILDAEDTEMLINSVRCYTNPETEVVAKRYKHEQMTVANIDSFWDCVIIYDFDKWFTNHGEGLNTKPIPRNLMYASGLYIKPIKDPNELKIEGAGEMTPFSMMEMALIDRINLEFLKPSEFSLIEI